jgi:3-hydroxyisobutyrate dehydrogenase
VVREVLTETDGGAFIKNAKPGTIVIDMSSSAPTGTREIAKEFAEKGIAFIDAPVSGAKPRAESGTLTIMIGGDDKAAIEKAKPLLSTMGESLFDTGGSGTGHAAKALNNFIAAATYAATSEAVLIAKRFGLSADTLIDIVSVSTGKSFISDIAMKHFVLNEKYGSGFALSLLTKDVGIAADLGRDVGLDAPIQRLTLERFKMANEMMPGADNTEAIKVWDIDLKD